MTDTMPRCATCVWWGYPRSPTDDQYTACDRMSYTGDYPVYEGTLANAFSREAPAVVFTHATFGCVMHEAPEEPES